MSITFKNLIMNKSITADLESTVSTESVIFDKS